MNNFLNPFSPLSGTSRRGWGAAGVVTVMLVWSIISGLELVSSNKLPSPLAVLNALAYLSYSQGHSALLDATLASVYRILAAAGLVLVVGIPLGVMMGASPRVNAVMSPLVDPFRSAPVVALLPIFVMWLGIGQTMKIAFLFCGAVVYMIPLVRDAMVSVPYSYWESTRDLGATHWECITKGVLPIAAPRIFDAAIVSTSILWTYITVAEYVNAESGLGQLIQNARRFSAMDQVFAGIFVIITLALLTYTGLTAIKKKVYFWEGTQ
jgi:ABC-type nitrate/sulfonate/bicarbonate transport system permease component